MPFFFEKHTEKFNYGHKGFLPDMLWASLYSKPTSSVFAVTVESSVEEFDSLLQVVSVQCHHPVTHHLLLPDQTLQLVATETLQPDGAFDEVSRVGLEIAQDPYIVINPKHAPLLCPSIHNLWSWDGMHPDSAADTCRYVSSGL